MTTDLVRTTPAAPAGLDMMTLGQTLAKSGYFTDARDAAQAVVKVLAGQEMGIGPVAAMTGIYIVKGRVTLSANLMAAQIKRSGRYSYRVARLDDTGCELVFLEQGQEIGRSSFTAEDAKAAGLWNSSDPWKKTPRNMLFARAMSNGAKWYCPDVFSGPVYTPDELNGPTVIEEAPPAPQLVVEPVREITTKAPEALSEIERLKRDCRALRDCERKIGLPPTPFSWNPRDGAQPLKDEIAASRARIEQAIPGLWAMVGQLFADTGFSAQQAEQFTRYKGEIDKETMFTLKHADLIAMAVWLIEQSEAATVEAELVDDVPADL